MCSNRRCVFLSNKEVYCDKHRGHVGTKEVLPEADVSVERCVFIDSHPDRPGRKIPRVLEAGRLALQIGKVVNYCRHLLLSGAALTPTVTDIMCFIYNTFPIIISGSLRVTGLGQLVELSNTPAMLLPDNYRYAS